MKTPQPIPYQGSKRALAPLIMNYFPEKVDRLIEPFAGSAAVSVAAAMKNKAQRFLINDINTSLINLLDQIVNQPDKISRNYEKLWQEQLGNEKEFFLRVRDRFNKEKHNDDLLYVLARCIKGAIRYNANGDFNQSADNRRKGKNPKNMKQEIQQVSKSLKGRSVFTSCDFHEVFELARHEDLIYMDPPYQGTCKNHDPRYFSGIEFDRFVKSLEYLNNKNVPYLISYDGKTGDRTYGNDLPSDLGLKKILIEVGRSTQSTLLGNSDITYEALYISNSLINKLSTDIPETVSLKPKQLELI
jgi:DNA adenine methylase